MKTNKYGTPKERIIKIALCVLFISFMFLASGAGKRFYLSQYQEECYQYATQTYVANWSYQDWKAGSNCVRDTSGWNILNCNIVTKYYYFNTTRFTDKCVKYHLVRYVD